MVRLTPERACRPPKRLLTSAMCNRGVLMVRPRWAGRRWGWTGLGFDDADGVFAVGVVGFGAVFMPGRGPQAGRAIEHDDDHGESVEQLAQDFGVDPDFAEEAHLHRFDDVTQHFGQRREDDAPEHDAGDVANAAEHDHGEDGDGFGEVERFGGDEALEGGEHGAGDPGEGGAHGEGEELDVAGVDAHGFGGNFVFTDGDPGAPEARILQTDGEEDDADAQQQEEEVVGVDRGHGQAEEFDDGAGAGFAGQRDAEDADGVDEVDALGPVGDVDGGVEVVHEDADDFAEAERDDGEVVAAQLQGGGAEQGAEERGDHGGEGDDDPEREVDAVLRNLGPADEDEEVANQGVGVDEGFEHAGELGRGEQAGGVGADGVEGDVAEVEQTGEADYDVQAEG